MILIGVGQGLAFNPLTNAGIANVTNDIAGSASGVVNVVHQIGSSVGLSITIALTAGIASPIDSYNHSVYILLVLAIISLIFCFNIDHITKNN